MLLPDLEEALRYLGAENAPEDLRRQTMEAGADLAAAVQPRYTYRAFSLSFETEGIRLREADLLLPGRDAALMLAQCSRAVLLACTLGTQFDRRLLALQARDMAKAALTDACGSALVEQGCGQAEREIAARFPEAYLTDRFSPGYGDLPLSLQPEISRALDLERRLGIHVSENFWMNPVKSVTAVIGLSDRPQMARIRGCGHCALRETCTLRKGGHSCAK